MSSTFHGLEIGKRALFAQQSALATTGHNVANANTQGYTRQRVEMQATKAMPYPGMHASTSPAQLGTGVDANKIVRLREDYLDVQWRGENHKLGYWEAKSDTLSKIEELLNEPTESGLAHVMDEFWKGWQELAKNPESAAVRSVVKQRGIAVAETFTHISNSLNQIQNDLKHVIDTKVNEINSLAEQISSLNGQIGKLVPNNYEPNDLYDQRDVLIDRLSKLVPVDVGSPNGNGMVDILVGGEPLVSGKQANELEIVGFDAITDEIKPSDIKIGEKDITLQSGELLGRIEAFGLEGAEEKSTIPNIKNQLDEMVKVFVEEVNTKHNQGVGLDGNVTGIDFFDPDRKSISTIQVNPELSSLDKIAAASKEEGVAGNGKNAQKIADLFTDKLEFFKEKPNQTTSTIGNFYQNIIGQLGIDAQESMRMQDNSEVIIQQVESRRLSVSGVSLDEEMVNMIRFQQAYNAAARYVTAMDQCLDKIINGMGRVGL